MLRDQNQLVFILLLVYQLKHFIADFPLQTKFMLGKFKPYPKFIIPLLSHAGVHGIFTFLIAYQLQPQAALPLALFDMVTHSIVDWLKANPSIGGRFAALSKNEFPSVATAASYQSDRLRDEKVRAIAQIKSNTYFWWALGVDQLAHHLTHYAIIWWLVT